MIRNWHTTFAASQNGVLVYEPGSKTLGSDLFLLDRSGKTLNKVGERGFYKGGGRLSPDGKRSRFPWEIRSRHLGVRPGSRSHTRLTFGGATYLMPSWSADGQRIIYVRQSGVTAVTELRCAPVWRMVAVRKKF